MNEGLPPVFHIMRIANGYLVILPTLPGDPMMGPVALISENNTHAFSSMEDALSFLKFKIAEKHE